MAKGQQFSLDGFQKNADGSYSKISNPQPREFSSVKIDGINLSIAKHNTFNKAPKKAEKTLTLTLFGIPMPKQSVRSYITGNNKIGHYQTKEKGDRTKDYIKQIKEQLPADFTPFMNEVFVTKFHCIYPPLKSFHKEKGKMERIRNGEIFYKNTQPDLIDNLKKLVFDCLGKDKKTKVPLVLGNDGIIVGEDNTRKYYGTGGCIIIEMRGT